MIKWFFDLPHQRMRIARRIAYSKACRIPIERNSIRVQIGETQMGRTNVNIFFFFLLFVQIKTKFVQIRFHRTSIFRPQKGIGRANACMWQHHLMTSTITLHVHLIQ